MPGQPYNPGHKRNIGVRPARIQPISTRDYGKAAQATDPSKYYGFGFKGGEA